MNMSRMNDLLMPRIESAAQWSLGQAVLRMIDRILWIVEKSVQWSLPSQDVSTEENGKTFGNNKLELVRPLPWIIFLPTLLFLRIIRVGLDTFGAVLGYPRVEPSDVVRVIQRGRRRLRAIKSSGLKSMRQKNNCSTAHQTSKDRALTMREASKNLAKSIRLTLSTLSCLDSASKTSPSPPPTKIRVSNILDTASPMTEETTAIDSAIGSPINQDGKRKYSELSGNDSSGDESDEEPLISKIDRLANMSGSDKDFSIDDCSSVEASDTSTSESEADVSIPLSEVEDITVETKELVKQYDALKQNAQLCTETKPDSELHKLTECLAKLEKLNSQPCTNGSKTQEELETTPEAIENDKHELLVTNGVVNDRDTAYYSPISWKSVSPDVSILLDKQDNQIDTEEKPIEEFNDEQINNGQEKEDCKLDGKNSCEVNGAHNVEFVKEKQRSSSQIGSSGANKHHQKHKRGNHGNRKKK